MRRSFSARIAAYATTPWFALAPTLLAHGQTNMYGGQPYVNPTYPSYPAYAAQQATPQPAAMPQPTLAQAAPQQAMQPPASYAYPAVASRPQAYMPGQTYPAQTYPVYQPGQPATAYQQPMYMAQTEPQAAAETVIPGPAAPGPALEQQPAPMADGQPVHDPAAAYGYPPACDAAATTPWSGYGCDQPAYGASSYANGGSCGAGAAYVGPTMTCSPPIVWEVYGGALLMFRDDENHYFYSYDSAIESNQYLDARDAYDDFLPGFEVGFRRFNACTCTGWEGVYWGLYPGDDSAMVYASDVTGNLDPILDFSQLDYNGNSADNYTNAASAHRVVRYSEIHNAELNRLWGMPGGSSCGACSPWSVTTLAGFRYFRVKDYLEFASDVNDTTFTGEADELYYAIDSENDLYGGQLGAQFERRTAGRFSFNGGVKAGVFCNSASATSWIGGAAGTAIVNNGPNAGREWLISAEKDDVAFLGEAKAGLAYQLSPKWRLLSDYRVIGVSGLALPTNQIYADLRGVNDVELLKTNGSLFLHGVFVGAECLF